MEFASKDDLLMAQTLTEEPEVPRKAEPLTMVEGWVAEQAMIKDRNRRVNIVILLIYKIVFKFANNQLQSKITAAHVTPSVEN